MPELMENEAITLSDRHPVTVDLLDGSMVTMDISELAEFIDENRENMKSHKSRRRREPLGFPFPED